MTSQEPKSLATIQELVRLPDIGVKEKFCTWTRVSLTSDHYLCVRHKQTQTEDNDNEDDKVMILSLGANEPAWSITQKVDCVSISPHADESTTNPYKLCIQDGTHLKVTSLTPELEQIAECSMTGLRYWCWLTSEIIAIVTHRSVFHWNLDEDVPKKMFSIELSLSDAEITSYKADAAINWLSLTGLTPEMNGVGAVTQLYSVASDISQCIVAHSTLYVTYKHPSSNRQYQLLCTACRDIETSTLGKVHIIPLSESSSACDNDTTAVTGVLTFSDDAKHYDFPVAMHASDAAGLLYVLTKYGMMFVCDLSTAQCLCQTRISKPILFASALTSCGNSLIAVNRAGQVLQIDLKTSALVEHVTCALNRPDVAKRLSSLLPPTSPLI